MQQIKRHMDNNNNTPKQGKLPYRVIALDLDGTLTNNEKEITPRTLNALFKAQEDGAVIVIASGRPSFGIKSVSDSLEMSTRGGYILSYNGGKIIDTTTHQSIFKKKLPEEVIPVIYHYAKEKGYALLGYKDGRIITEMPDDEYVWEERRVNKMEIDGVDNLLDALVANPCKLLMTGHEEDMAKAEADLKEMLGDKMDIFRSAPFDLELVPKGIDKAKTLGVLLDLLGLTPDDLIAFGDGYNDLSMIQFAGMGVAMDNAVPELKEAADYITLSNEEDGVAAALEHFSKGV